MDQDLSSWLGTNAVGLVGALVALVAAFIGLPAALLAIRHMRSSTSSDEPTMMVGVDAYANGVTVSVTIRNRRNNPIIVKSIGLEGRKVPHLAPLKSPPPADSSGTILTEQFGATSIPMMTTLSSADENAPKDRMKRTYGVLSYGPLPSAAWVVVCYDPNDGRPKTMRVKRKVDFPPAKFGLPTAHPIDLSGKKVRYSFRASS